MAVPKGLSKKELADPCLAFPALCEQAVAMVKALRIRAAGGIVIPVQPLVSPVGTVDEVGGLVSGHVWYFLSQRRVVVLFVLWVCRKGPTLSSGPR